MSDDVVIDKAVVKEILDKTATVEWGFMDDGVFVPLPKLPLINSGYMQPPFDVKLPNGMVRSIIEQPKPAGGFDVTLPNGDTVRVREPERIGYIEKIEEKDMTLNLTGYGHIEPPAIAPPKLKVTRKIKVYTASKLNNAPTIRDHICRWPEVEVVSRWPFSHVDGDQPLWPEDCGAHASIFWQHDEEDVRKADIVLLFGNETDVLRGGLVEAGIAIGLGKPVIVVGSNPSYGTWQFHPLVYRVKDLDTARSLLALLAHDLTARS